MSELEPTHEELWWNAAWEVAGNYKGSMFEARFESTLDSLIEQGQISTWYKTGWNTIEDHHGIDYILDFEGHPIPWQITSTYSEARKHRKMFNERGLQADIPITYIRSGKPHLMRNIPSLEREIISKAIDYMHNHQTDLTPLTDF